VTKRKKGWSSAADPAGGAYSMLPDLLAGFKGLREGRKDRRGGQESGMGRIGKGREEEERGASK